jgi:hypothetical protein
LKVDGVNNGYSPGHGRLIDHRRLRGLRRLRNRRRRQNQNQDCCRTSNHESLVPYNTDLEGCPNIADGALTRAHVHQRLSANAHSGHLNIQFSVLTAYQNDPAIFGC